MYVSDIRKDFFDVIVNQRVLILVNFDVDGLCSAKILQYLFQCDHVCYTLIPVEGKTELIQRYRANRDGIKYVLLLNCGGSLDLVDFLDPDDDVVFFVADSHRPVDVCNVYNDGQIRLLMRPDSDEAIPDYDDIFKDSDDEENDDDDDDEEGYEGNESKSKRARYDEETLLKRRERRVWEERRNKILFDYQQFSYFGPSTAMLMYELAWKMSRDSNDLLWWAIVGHCEQFLLLKTEVQKYVVETSQLRDHVSRLNNADGSNGSIDCMKLAFDKELNLNLYRHWSVFESLHHTAYTAAKFKIWTLKGRQRLYEFLAELGLPLAQCKQKFSAMDLGLRNDITSIFESKADKYNMDNITYGSFTASFGYRHKFCASDLVYSILALMERSSGGIISSSEDGFLQAMDSLSRSHIDLLNTGIEMAKERLEIVMNQVQNFLDLRLIVPAGPFLYAIIQDGTPNSQFFSRPNCLALLAQFTLRAHVAVTSSRKVQNLPLVISSPLNPELGTCLVLGVPPVTDRSRKNLLGKAFEQAAQKTNSKYLLDFFDSSVIQLKTEDRSKFFDGLISLLT